MILNALVNYYQSLLETNLDDGVIPTYGYSLEHISYVIVLFKEGKLLDIQNHQDLSGKKPKPKLVIVPIPKKRTSGIAPCFLWDKSAYVLGVAGKKGSKQKDGMDWEYTKDNFKAFRQLHLDELEKTDDIGLQALRIFLKSWQPENFIDFQSYKNILDTNIVFKLDSETEFLHEKAVAKNIWSQLLEKDDEFSQGYCLLSGQYGPIARLHPPIKGGYFKDYKGKATCSIVSFNRDSFKSYGKEKGENSPISEYSAFAYTTALNYLLRVDNNQCISLGDTSTVFWAVSNNKKMAHEAETLFAELLKSTPDDNQEVTQIRPILDKISKGYPLNEFLPNIHPETRFYVLGLSPNSSRISIRYWLDTSFGVLTKYISDHYKDLSLNPSFWRYPPSVRYLLSQTLRHRKKTDGTILEPDYKQIAPQLAGEMIRSIITGLPYPRMLLCQLIQRIRTDGDINEFRVAMIKAIIQREYRKGLVKEEMPMSLNIESKNIAYRLGRLFAVIEYIQESAAETKLNSTVTDKYYGSASSVPFSVFPRLLSGSQNHLSKISKERPGQAINLKKELTEIIDGLETNFPKHLSLEEQGRFTLGYYHQKKFCYTSHKKSEGKNSDATNN